MANPCAAPVEAKKAYATRLAPQLVKDHGKRHRYTQREIDQSIVNAGLSIDWACWGYVMFLDQPTFNKLHADSGEPCSYDGMHLEMGHYLAEAAQAGNWFPSLADWSIFDVGSWSWPDLGGLVDIELPDLPDIDLPDIG